MWISETDLETEPTEPGPLGKKTIEEEEEEEERTDNQLFSLSGDYYFAVCLISRLQRGAVSLHQTLLCSQAMQAVPQQPLLLQVRAEMTFISLSFYQSKPLWSS